MKVIVIGANSGIGRELALLYAKAGHRVGITGRRHERLREIKALFPQNVSAACFDVTDSENIRHLQNLISELGGLDLLVYNAGIGEPSPDLVLGVEMMTTKTNVVGFVEVAAFAFNSFVQQGYGQLAVVSSVAALRGNSVAPAYSASKAFASNYAEGLNLKARRLKTGIVVIDIRPGFINTKPAKDHKRFWVAQSQKAAGQIFAAIEKKKRVAYVTKRWWLVAQILKVLPFRIWRRFA